MEAVSLAPPSKESSNAKLNHYICFYTYILWMCKENFIHQKHREQNGQEQKFTEAKQIYLKHLFFPPRKNKKTNLQNGCKKIIGMSILKTTTLGFAKQSDML